MSQPWGFSIIWQPSRLRSLHSCCSPHVELTLNCMCGFIDVKQNYPFSSKKKKKKKERRLRWRTKTREFDELVMRTLLMIDSGPVEVCHTDKSKCNRFMTLGPASLRSPERVVRHIIAEIPMHALPCNLMHDTVVCDHLIFFFCFFCSCVFLFLLVMLFFFFCNQPKPVGVIYSANYVVMLILVPLSLCSFEFSAPRHNPVMAC